MLIISGNRGTGAKNNVWSCGFAEGQISRPKTVLSPCGSYLPPASESYVTPSRPFEKEIFVSAQERTTLLEEPPEARRS
jgi:hypothetical protein